VLVVLVGLAPGLGGRAGLVQVLLGAEAGIGAAALDQFLRVPGVDVPPLGLDVGAVIAAHVRALVIFQARQPHRAVDLLHRAGHLPLLVGVLDAQDERAAVAPGVEVGVQRRPEASQVQIAGGAGRESGANHVNLSLSFNTFTRTRGVAWRWTAKRTAVSIHARRRKIRTKIKNP